MGARGPLAQSAELRMLRGNPGKHETKASLKAKPEVPEAPSDMQLEAQKEWRRIVAELDELGVIAKLDRAVLTAYCETWAFNRQLSTELEGGLVVKGSTGERKSPAWQMYRETVNLLTALSKELMATPATRARMPAPDDQDEGNSILD